MDSYGWLDSGFNPLMDADGHPWFCPHCPCAPCLGAILQRQHAVKNFGGTWIDIDGSYTLDELKAFVNALCAGIDGCFVAGPYDGGVNPPTWLPAMYADSATTVDELCALVSGMIYTRVSAALGDRQLRNGVGGNIYQTGTESEMNGWYAVAAAVWNAANWSTDSVPSCRAHSVGAWPIAPAGQWVVGTTREANQLTYSGVWTGLDHAAKVFMQAQPLPGDWNYGLESIFDSCGTGFIEGYNLVGTFGGEAIAGHTTDWIDLIDSPPPALPFSITEEGYHGGTRGFLGDVGSNFAILEWSFTA